MNSRSLQLLINLILIWLQVSNSKMPKRKMTNPRILNPRMKKMKIMMIIMTMRMKMIKTQKMRSRKRMNSLYKCLCLLQLQQPLQILILFQASPLQRNLRRKRVNQRNQSKSNHSFLMISLLLQRQSLMWKHISTYTLETNVWMWYLRCSIISTKISQGSIYNSNK